MTDNTRNMPIRLALRVEGQWWVAYLAKRDSMEDAKELGRILMSTVENDKTNKQMFMDLMSRIISVAVEDMFGVKPDRMEVQQAPEHERAGRA